MSEAVRRPNGSGLGAIANGTASWIDVEVAGCALGDKRLSHRLRQLLQQLEGAMGAPLPLACQDWANTKAAYRSDWGRFERWCTAGGRSGAHWLTGLPAYWSGAAGMRLLETPCRRQRSARDRPGRRRGTRTD